MLITTNLEYLRRFFMRTQYGTGATPLSERFVLEGATLKVELTFEEINRPLDEVKALVVQRIRDNAAEEVRNMRALADLKERTIAYVTVETFFGKHG